jgi:hypothetical protein
MKRRFVNLMLWVLTPILVTCHCPPVFAAGVIAPGHAPPPAKFKLHVAQYGNDVYEIPNANGWRPARKVDPKLVEQIGQIRLALPNWQGVHYIRPGSRSN